MSGELSPEAAAYVAARVAEAPPLSEATRARLAALLRAATRPQPIGVAGREGRQSP